MSTQVSSDSWVIVGGSPDAALDGELNASVSRWIESGKMPSDDPERVGRLSTAIASGTLSASPKRLELLRGLCHLYSAEIRAEKISSHRPVIGPVIVFAKKVLLRMVATLLGPTFRRQREFNAAVIQLLGDICNEDASTSRGSCRK